MRVILHDLTEAQWGALHMDLRADDEVVTFSGNEKFCTGCFGCWLKTPGKCVIPDAYQCMGERLSRADELIIISKCSFGSYSSKIKNILDRSISYVSPFFVIRKGEMHHKPRYENKLTVSVLFYGADITEAEKETARSLVTANALNLNGQVGSVRFMEGAVW